MEEQDRVLRNYYARRDGMDGDGGEVEGEGTCREGGVHLK